jgi:predicted dehydrogenase/threonine dehydrogenase-like Zn-dependent dehydrogenase
MRQVLQDARSGAINVEEVPAPHLLPGCVLVRIAASIVSAGTERASVEFARKNLLEKARSRPDLVREVMSKVQRDGILSAVQAVRSRLDQPQSPGYSSAGTVVAIGEGVTDIQPGDRVACAGRGFAVHAEIACIPRLLLARIPAGSPISGCGEVPLDQAAFATLGAVALHGVRTAEAKLGDMVAVIGLGLLGQLTTQLLKVAGCHVLGMDIDPSRAQLASQMGADALATSASEFRDLCLQASRGGGVDCVLITAETPSSDPVNLAGAIARDRAVVVAVGTVGMDLERKSFYDKEIQFRISRSYGPGRYDTAYEQKGRDYPIGYVRWTETRNMEAFIELLAEGKLNLDPLISHRFPIEEAHRAYELISGKSRERFLGVVIQYIDDVDRASSLALASAFSISGQPRATTNDVTVGLLGAGGFASSTLIPAMKNSSQTSLMTICAATGSHAKHAANKFGFRKCTTDEAGLVQDPEINTIVIATRHHLHAGQVLSALSAGKNVFCEKPLCLSEEELRTILSAYWEIPGAQKPALMVGFNRRFAPMVKQMKAFLATIREPLALHYRINAGYLGPDHWMNDREQGGGRVLGEVCHFIDLMMFLAGSPIIEVATREVGSTGQYSGDNVLISIRFGNGSEGIISYLANGDRSFSKERIEVFGGRSIAVLDDFRRMELLRNGRAQKVRSRLRQDKGHRAEWAAFVDSVRPGKHAPITFEDIVCSTLATLRAEESRKAGKPLAVDAAGFLRSSHVTSTLHPDRNA